MKSESGDGRSDVLLLLSAEIYLHTSSLKCHRMIIERVPFVFAENVKFNEEIQREKRFKDELNLNCSDHKQT